MTSSIRLKSEVSSKNPIERIAISARVYQELFKDPRFRIMFYLQDHGESMVYAMSKELKWTPTKTHAIIRQLIKSKVISSRIELKNGRTNKYVKLNGVTTRNSSQQ